MARAPLQIPDAEWAVLELLWERGSASVRQLTEVLYPKGGPSEYATVHRLLERLEAKGFVRRARSTGVYVFQAAIARDDAIGRQLETLVDKICAGSLQPLLLNLMRAKRLTPDQMRDLANLIENIDSKTKPKKPRKQERS